MNHEQPFVYRVDDAARLLSISRSEAYTLIAKGIIPSIRIGKNMIRIPAEALREMVDQATRAAQADNEQGGQHDDAA